MTKMKFIHPSVWFGFLILLPTIPLVAAGPTRSDPDSPPSAAYRSLNVVSLNIRGGEGEMRDPPELRWSNRKQVVAREILRTQPDVIGLQEVMHIQFRDLSLHVMAKLAGPQPRSCPPKSRQVPLRKMKGNCKCRVAFLPKTDLSGMALPSKGGGGDVADREDHLALTLRSRTP